VGGIVLDALPLSGKQLTSCRESAGRVNIWEGSIRSGKTITALLRWLIYCATAPRGGELVMIGRTRDSVWRNMVAPMQDPDLFGIISDQVIGNYGAPTVAILGRRVHILGASDAKAEKVIRGMTVAGACVDELTTIPEEFFTQLLGRMSITGAQLFGTTNPDNPAHWLKRKFLDRLDKLPDWRSWKFTIDDNPSLSPNYVESIKREYTGLWYRRFILGEWVAAEGAIFDMWDPDKHIVPWETLPEMRRLLAVGVDFGTTNATSAMLLGISDVRNDYGHRTGSNLWLVDEWRYDPATAQLRKTNEQLSGELRAWLHADHLPYRTHLEPEWVFLDPAAASFQVQLQADGLPNVRHADNSVSYGIGTVASLLSSGHLHTTTRTPGFNQEAPGYSWDPKATSKGEDKPVKVADHSLDAGRYAITSTESVWRPMLTV
jgi:PBSX family phage terminase large subunit